MNELYSAIKRRILVLDGGMGTMIQQFSPTETDYRGERYKDYARPLLGNNDVLALSRPDILETIHRQYLEAGADIIETCSFGANAVCQAEYGLEKDVWDMALAAARIARKAVDSYGADTGKRKFVAGSVGPTKVSLSIASNVDRPEVRDVSFDALSAAYYTQIDALVEGRVDLILCETIFDLLTAKAAYDAYLMVLRTRGLDPQEVPIIFSFTLADVQGRLLNGQTLEAVCAAVEPLCPMAIGLNCGFGADETERFLGKMARYVDLPLVCYPNAGLPDECGAYSDDAARMSEVIRRAAECGLVNIVGGCCGTTPEHIRAMAAAVSGIKPRSFGDGSLKRTTYCGLEAFTVQDGTRAVIAERTNVTGSRKFKRLIGTGAWEEAVDVARQQMRSGAKMLDICMDDAMLDAPSAMAEFLRRLCAEPEVSKYGFVIDSSNFAVIRRALREIPGRCLVNSISLKNGESEFLREAEEIRAFGAGVVVMAFDEEGQASTTQRRIDILTRAVELLITRAHFDMHSIVVDPNILAIGTGLPEHDLQAVSFLEACHALKKRFPGIQTSGGLSNLSFSFRGRDDVREAIHQAFLEMAGDDLTMVIANPDTTQPNDRLDAELRALVGDLVRGIAGTTDRLLDWMQSHELVKTEKNVAGAESVALEAMEPAKRLEYALVSGESRFVKRDIEALGKCMTALQIIEGPLMDAMNVVGEKFGRGEMFLPQIIKAARLMKQAISYLDLDQQSTSSSRKKVLLATVWGDVHDIGKNIVSTVLSCNGYDVIDLGVMVETQRIVDEARKNQVDAIGLSGLISPSLREMEKVAFALKQSGLILPLFVGGAATSDEHTALKIAPVYAPGVVTHIADASKVPGTLGPWLNSATKSDTEMAIVNRQEDIRRSIEDKKKDLVSIEVARASKTHYEHKVNRALLDAALEIEPFVWSAESLIVRINYVPLMKAMGMTNIGDKAGYERTLREDCEEIVRAASVFRALEVCGRYRFVEARGLLERDGIEVKVDGKSFVIETPRARKRGAEHVSLCDFVDSEAWTRIGMFAMTCHVESEKVEKIARYVCKNLAYVKMLCEGLATCLVSAANDALHDGLRRKYGHCVRPAPGYPVLPDHGIKAQILEMLNGSELGIGLTEGQMMTPLASICGISIFHEAARIFSPE